MKRLFFLLMILSVASAVQSEPPIENITVWNNGRAVELNNLFYENISEGYELNISWYRYGPLVLNGSMGIAGITPLIDNITTSGDETKIIVSRGYLAGHLEGLDGLPCGDGRSPDDADCDFDGDGCAETEKEFHVFSLIGIKFTLRNTTEYTEETEVEHILGQPYEYSASNMVDLPDNITAEMENASGRDMLYMELNGEMTFVYVINNRSKSGLDCITNYAVIEKTLSFKSNFSCLAGGNHKLFFLETPPVSDQWFRNNKIEIIALSQKPLYHALLLKNDSEVLNTQIYDFNTSENYFEIKEIYSVPEDNDSYLGIVNVTPTPLEREEHTYAYLYRFNYTFGKVLGKSNFELEVADFFLEEESVHYTTYSKQLSYGNQTETGEEAAPETTRRSVVFEKQSSQFVEIIFGILGVAVIILFLRFTLR